MALEPLVFSDSVATSDSFTLIDSVDRFNLTQPASDELEFPQRLAGIGVIVPSAEHTDASDVDMRTNIPSLREPCDQYFGTIGDDVGGQSFTFPHLDLMMNPLNPGALERMQIEAKGDDGGVADRYQVVLLGTDGGQRSIPDGPRRTLTFSTTDAPTAANTYNRLGIELDQTLQNGNYEVIGTQVYGTDVAAFGLDFENRTGIYGGIGLKDETSSPVPYQQPGALNSGYGQFRDSAPPDLVAYMNGTTDDVRGHIDIVGPV